MKIRNVSASQVSAFERCQRYWYFGWIMKIRSPTTPAQQRGTDIHAEIEHYLKTGDIRETKWAPYAKAAAEVLKGEGVKPASDDLVIEQEFSMPTYDGGPPWRGYIDIGWSGSPLLKILDTKTTSDFRYAKTKVELKEDIQVNSYGAWVFNVAGYPKDKIVLGHVYIHSRLPKTKLPNTKVVSFEATREEVNHYWARDVKTVREMVKLANDCDKPEDVTPTTSACSMYGGCPHLSRCGIAGSTFNNYFSKKKSTNNEGVTPVSNLLAKLKKAKAPENESEKTAEEPTKTETSEAAPAEKPAKKGGLAAKMKAKKGSAPKAETKKVETPDEAPEEMAVLPPDAPNRTTPVKTEEEKAAEAATAEKPKKKRAGRKKNAAASGPVIFINCYPTKGAQQEVVRYEDWFHPLLSQMNDVASENNNVAGYWSLGFAEQKDFIGRAVDEYVKENGLPAQLIITTGMPLVNDVLFAITPHAAMVIQGK